MPAKALPSNAAIQESHVRVAPSTIAGNGLFATKHIAAASSIVIAQRPLLGELDLPRLQDTCANCFTWSSNALSELGRPVNVSACSGCKKVRYCTKTCQKQAWSRSHKHECKLLRDPALPPLPSSVRAALQLTAYMAGKSVSEEDKAAVRRLESHDASTYTQLNEVEQFEINVQAAKDVFERLSPGDPEASQIQEYVGKILRNSLTLTTPTLDPLGLAFDPLVCTANHSCTPNAIVLFDSPRLLLRSLSPIQAGEEIFISYIDTTNPFSRRQLELHKRYCFTCRCPKCTSDATKHVEPSIRETESFRLLEQARGQDAPTAISTLTELLAANDRPPTTQPAISARMDLIPQLLAADSVGLALKHLATVYAEVDPAVYAQPWHPVRLVHTWTLIRTLLTAYQMPQDPARAVDPEVAALFERGFDFAVVIWRLLVEVSGAVEKSHGAGSVRDMVLGLVDEMRDGVGEGNLEVLARDPLGVWGAFLELAREVR